MKKTVGMLLIIILLSKFGGFIMDIAITYYYGASYITDAYIVSITIPNTVLALISTGINTSYIPIYSDIEKKYGPDKCNDFTNYMINLLVIFCATLCVVVLLFTKPIILVLASGFEAEALELAILFTRLGIVQLIFLAVSYLLHAYLQLKKSFLVPGLLSFPMKLIVILSIVISYKTDKSILVIGTVAASLTETAILLILSYRKQYKYKPKLNIKDESLKKLGSLVLPAIAGTSTSQLNQMVDKTIASRTAEGGISALNYAHQLEGFISGTVVQSALAVVYPDMAKKAAHNDITGLKKMLNSALILVSLLIIPGTIGAMVFSEPIVEMLFSRGAFDYRAVSMTASAWFFYSTGMLWFGARALMVRVFYTLHDTKSPVKNSFIGVAINIVLNIVLSRYLGVGGLALATSISEFISMNLLMTVLRKKIRSLHIKQLLVPLVKILVASLLMGHAAYQAYQFLGEIFNKTLSLLLSIFLGVVFYTAFILLFKIEFVDLTVRSALERLRKKLISGFLKKV